MGGKGSGRIPGRTTTPTLAELTPEARQHQLSLRRQNGDFMFEADRRMSDGSWWTCGRLNDSKMETVGAAFGGGEYRIFAVDPATDDRTEAKPVVRRISPAQYPIDARYSKTPRELERDELDDEDDELDTSPKGNTQEWRARTAEKIRRELEREQLLRDMKRELEDLRAKVTSGQMGPMVQSASERMAEMREMIALTKELQPPPTFGQPMMPTDPIAEIKKSVELVKMLKEDLGVGQSKENPALNKLIEGIISIGNQSIQSQLQRPLLPPSPQLPARQPGGQAATATVTKTQEDLEREAQMAANDFYHKLASDQADQLTQAPKSHISETVAWIRAHQFWTGLKELLPKYNDDQVVQYLGSEQPVLTDSQVKKDWLRSVLDLLRR